jgi:hypothetical protein
VDLLPRRFAPSYSPSYAQNAAEAVSNNALIPLHQSIMITIPSECTREFRLGLWISRVLQDNSAELSDACRSSGDALHETSSKTPEDPRKKSFRTTMMPIAVVLPKQLITAADIAHPVFLSKRSAPTLRLMSAPNSYKYA